MSNMKNSSDFRYEFYSSVVQHRVEWLWYPYIPYGKLTILQGDPGEGKSTFILNVAALLTRGKNLPNGYETHEPQNVVYQTAEDNLSDTVKPRLVKAGADCERIAYIIDEETPLTLEDTRIERVIQQTNAKLFILDPLQAYLSQDSDMNSAGRMRNQLKKLADIAARQHCAVVIIGHMNKASGEKNLYRGLGSIDIAAIARSVLMITRDKENPAIRYMFPVKSSLAPEGPAVSFTFDEKHGLTWGGQCDPPKYDTDALFPDGGKKEFAVKVIQDILSHGDAKGSEIANKLKLMGISERTIQSAKKEIQIVSYRKEKKWMWHLPEDKDLREHSDV